MHAYTACEIAAAHQGGAFFAPGGITTLDHGITAATADATASKATTPFLGDPGTRPLQLVRFPS